MADRTLPTPAPMTAARLAAELRGDGTAAVRQERIAQLARQWAAEHGVTPAVKFMCVCGEQFAQLRLLVQHRKHERGLCAVRREQGQ